MRKPEPAKRVNARVKKCRAAKRLRDLRSQYDSQFAMDLRKLYQGRKLPAHVWVPLAEFLQGQSEERQAVLERFTFSGSENSVVQIGDFFVQLIRPKAGL
jgi:hypothetical protein